MAGSSVDVVEQAVALFYSTFTQYASVPREALTIAAAPGRVNLIGEHTDYNDGFVCPFAAEHEYCNVPCGIMDQFIS
ncbi:GalactoKinase, partial [Phytophthora palmivora]